MKMKLRGGLKMIYITIKLRILTRKNLNIQIPRIPRGVKGPVPLRRDSDMCPAILRHVNKDHDSSWRNKKTVLFLLLIKEVKSKSVSIK